MKSGIKKSAHARLLMKIQHGRCFICEKPMGWDDATRDHLLPRSVAPVKGYRNVVLAHSHCNNEKGSAMPTKEQEAKFRRIRKKNLKFPQKYRADRETI